MPTHSCSSRWLALAVLPLFILASCQGRAPSPSARPPASPPPNSSTSSSEGTAAPIDTNAIHQLAYTHQNADGNRYVAGRGDLPEARPIDIELAGSPLWLVGAPLDGGSLWVALLTDGRAQAFKVIGSEIALVDVQPPSLPGGTPPLLWLEKSMPTLLTAPSDTASAVTHPIILSPSGQLAYIESNGDLVVQNEGGASRLPVDALPDARLLADERGRLLFLSGPTDDYRHGVLGDGLEATSITLVETRPNLRVLRVIPAPPGQVIEGIAPIWTDLDGDGRREIIATLSDSTRGARLVVFNESGEQVAASQPIGQGFRWRHQLAVAPFGPQGEPELADVLTPHIGGTLEFFQLDGDDLSIIAQVGGYTSHLLGSRNLDMAVAGDFDGDGKVELLLPNQALTSLGAIRRSERGAQVVWELPLEGKLSTNLAVVAFENGELAVGVGRQDGALRLWLP